MIIIINIIIDIIDIFFKALSNPLAKQQLTDTNPQRAFTNI